jgi:hypothetical protein
MPPYEHTRARTKIRKAEAQRRYRKNAKERKQAELRLKEAKEINKNTENMDVEFGFEIIDMEL